MDYIYGTLNDKVRLNTYNGGRTSSADVTVDNVNNIIYVNAHADTSYVDNMITQRINLLDYSDSPVNQKFVSSVNETNGIINVTRRLLNTNDIPVIPINKTDGLQAALDSKQNNLGFEDSQSFPYDPVSNKVVTNNVLTDRIQPLQGAMHYLGITTTGIYEGSTQTVITIGGQSVTVKKGDLVSYPDTKSKWHFNGLTWNSYIDLENAVVHVSGGDISNSDIKSSANIDPTKINSLRGAGNTGYLDKIDILLSNDTTPGSIAKSIKDAIEALDVSDAEVAGKFVTTVSEANGIITVGRRSLQTSDFGDNLINKSSIINLTSDLDTINTNISKMHLKKDGGYVTNNEYEFETGKILSKIKQENGIVNIVVKDLTEADIPTISYTKINNWPQADWNETVSTSQSFIKNKPSIVYNSSLHCLQFTGI